MEETLKYFNMLNSDESDVSEVDVCIVLPNKSADIAENKNIQNADLGKIILADMTIELHILYKEEDYDATSIQEEKVQVKVVMISLHTHTHTKKTLEKTRWNKRKKTNHIFPDEEPIDLKTYFPELQDLDCI